MQPNRNIEHCTSSTTTLPRPGPYSTNGPPDDRLSRLTEIADGIQYGVREGRSATEVLNALLSDVYDLQRDTQVEKFSFKELHRAYPHLNDPVVNGLIRTGETANIISYSKQGKSWMAYNLALSIITGRPWLGRFETDPGRVLLIDSELHKPTVSHRIPVVADALGIPPDRYEDDLEVWPLRGKLRSLQALTLDIMAITPDEFRLILLDSKYRFAAPGKDENSNADETADYNLIDQWAEHTGAAIALIHHSSKGSQSDKRITDVGAGAGAQSRAADCHIILREHEEPDTVVLDAAVRSFAPVDPLPLRWSFPLWQPAIGVDPNLLKGRRKPGEDRQSEKDREGVNKIIKALAEWKPDDGPATARQLRSKTGISKDRQQRLLDLMQFEDHVSTKPTTVRGNPTFEYSLNK